MASFTFRATDDSVAETGETVVIGLGALPGGFSAVSPRSTSILITDDTPAVQVDFGAATYTAAEGGTVTVEVTLDADPQRTVTIPLTKANQGSTSDADYSGVPASVEFNSGETSKTFTFTATDDSESDDGESVKLGFGTLPSGVSAGTTSEATVSITDNDDPAVTVSFAQSAYTIDEVDDPDTDAVRENQAVIEVRLSAAPGRQVVVPLTRTNQGGASDSDYDGVLDNVTFSATQTSRTFTFTAIDDTVDDDGESVKLAFGTLPTGGDSGNHGGDRCLHHGQRRSRCQGELRGGHVHGERGQLGYGDRDSGCGAGAGGGGAADRHQRERGVRCRLQRRPGQRDLHGKPD